MKIKSNTRDYQVYYSKNVISEIERLSSHHRCFFVVDKNVYSLYSDFFTSISKEKIYVLDATEHNKTFSGCNKLMLFLLENSFKRNDRLVAFGGGIVQDVSCFVSSVLFRGVDWVFFPTTLLAQCDSCIGSKSSINIGEFKNQIGTFYPPSEIIINTDFLKTLGQEEILSGVGEAIKVHYLDPQKDYSFIVEQYDSIFAEQRMEELIKRSLRIKKTFIEIDEHDKNIRNVLNYGHTFGHAIESAVNYSIPHGIAVTAGIAMANYISYHLGFLSKQDYDKMLPALKKNIANYASSVANIDPNLLYPALRKDKKNVDDRVCFILTRGFGEMFKHHLSLDDATKDLIFSSLRCIV